MTTQQAKALGTTVAKTSSGVRVKFGQTNGRPCLHLLYDRQSHTIYSEAEWEDHPENRVNKPRRPRATFDPAIRAAVANKEAK